MLYDALPAAVLRGCEVARLAGYAVADEKDEEDKKDKKKKRGKNRRESGRIGAEKTDKAELRDIGKRIYKWVEDGERGRQERMFRYQLKDLFNGRSVSGIW